MPVQDTSISPLIGFGASTWRAGGEYTPDYDTYAPTNVTYTGAPYGIPGAPSTYSVNVSNIYGQLFWDTFFETIFPSITTADFLGEMSTGTPGGYFIEMFRAAALDFYDSFFQGRDDSGSLGSSLTTTTDPDTLTLWNGSDLSDSAKKLIIKKYLISRGLVDSQTYTNGDGQIIDRAFTKTMYLNNLNLRTTNIFFYVAMLMVGIMNELQRNTINASQYATRLAETQQAISTQMTSSEYNYRTVVSANDYSTQALNENHGQQLENLRTFRDLCQKETDQASTYLSTSQQGVEDAASKALEFLKKGHELVALFFRAF